MENLKKMITSKKFIVMLLGIALYLGLTLAGYEADLPSLIALLSSYIVGQGIADNGKEKAKMENDKSGNGYN